MRKYNYLFLTPLLIAFIGCNSSDKVKVDENVTQNLHPRKVEKSTETNNTTEITATTLTSSSVQQELENYLNALSSFQAYSVVEMTYPRLFEVVNKEHFRQYMESMMNANKIQIQSYTTNITNVSEVTRFTNNTAFAQAEYESNIVIAFIDEQLYNSKDKIDFLYDALVHKYGKENIQIDKNMRTLTIKRLEKLLMIQNEMGEWKFLGDNVKYRKYYPTILPYEILQRLD